MNWLPESPLTASRSDLALHRAIAILVVAQAAVVGLQVVGRHALHRPIPWTEEIARLLLAWLMCVGGIAALRHSQHPRVTAPKANSLVGPQFLQFAHQ